MHSKALLSSPYCQEYKKKNPTQISGINLRHKQNVQVVCWGHTLFLCVFIFPKLRNVTDIHHSDLTWRCSSHKHFVRFLVHLKAESQHIYTSLKTAFPLLSSSSLNSAQPQMVGGAPTAITSPVLDSKLPVPSTPSVLPSSTHHFSPASPRASPGLNFAPLCFAFLGNCPEPLILQDLSTDTDATAPWAVQLRLLILGSRKGQHTMRNNVNLHQWAGRQFSEAYPLPGEHCEQRCPA